MKILQNKKNKVLPNLIYNETFENENLCRLHELSGERRLLLGILDRAFMDLTHDDIKIRQDAERWFNTPDVEDPGVTTLQYICFLFNLNRSRIINRIHTIVNNQEKHREIIVEYVLNV